MNRGSGGTHGDGGESSVAYRQGRGSDDAVQVGGQSGGSGAEGIDLSAAGRGVTDGGNAGLGRSPVHLAGESLRGTVLEGTDCGAVLGGALCNLRTGAAHRERNQRRRSYRQRHGGGGYPAERGGDVGAARTQTGGGAGRVDGGHAGQGRRPGGNQGDVLR